MKKLILLSIMILSLGFSLSAQKEDSDPTDSRKKVEASKVAFITTYLNMTSAESAEFWPVYNEYKEKSSAIRSKSRGEMKASEMTDTEATAKLNARMEADGQRVDLRKQYYSKFRNILSDKKVLMLIEAESEFRKQMVRQYASRRSSPQGMPKRK